MYTWKVVRVLLTVAFMIGCVSSLQAGLIERSGWKFKASPTTGGEDAVIDGKAGSWDSGQPQKKGSYFQIELPSPEVLSGAIILHNGRNIEFKVSLNGSDWALTTSSAREFKFSSIKAKFIKLVLGDDSDKNWQINEVYLFNDKAKAVIIDDFESGSLSNWSEGTQMMEVGKEYARDSLYGIKFNFPKKNSFRSRPKDAMYGLPQGSLWVLNNCDAITFWVKEGTGSMEGSISYYTGITGLPTYMGKEATWLSTRFSPGGKEWRKVILLFNYFKSRADRDTNYKKIMDKYPEKFLFLLSRMLRVSFSNAKWASPASGYLDDIKAELFIKDFTQEKGKISYELLDEAKSAVIKIYPADVLYIPDNLKAEVEGAVEPGVNKIEWGGFSDLASGNYTGVIEVKDFLDKLYSTQSVEFSK